MNETELANYFLDPFVSAKEVSAVTMDGCSLSNLTSLDPTVRANSFQVEHFIRPPVHVEVEFASPVHLACVLLEPQLGQAECQVEVSISAGIHYRHCGSVNLKGRRCMALLRNNILHLHSPVVYGSFAHHRENTEVINHSLRYRPDMRRVKHLRLSVTRLSGHLPFRLNSLEVWGLGSPESRALLKQSKIFSCCFLDTNQECICKTQPTVSTSRLCMSPVDAFKKGEGLCSEAFLWLHQRAPESLTVVEGNQEGTQQSSLGQPTQLEMDGCKLVSEKPNSLLEGTKEALQDSMSIRAKHFNSLSIPDKYTDELTCEVMLVPMKLPSGHFVDKATLERLEENDLSYGRQPCDPFTGVPFAPASKPLFSPELKEEIDSFLSVNSTAASKTGRTVGSGVQIAEHWRNNLAQRPPSAGGPGSLPQPAPHRSEAGGCSHSEGWLPGMDSSHESAVSESLDKALKDLFPSCH